jgi:hypothetical protein
MLFLILFCLGVVSSFAQEPPHLTVEIEQMSADETTQK